MEGLFLKVFGMSVTGSIVILITLLARFLLKNRSKRFIMILWAFVAIRLLVPVGFESSLSIFNFIPLKTQTFTVTSRVQAAAVPDDQAANQDVRYISIDDADNAANDALSADLGSSELLPDTKTIISELWFVGAAGIAGFCFVRYIMLKRKLKNAKHTGGNVYVSEKIGTPFVFGLFMPRIYLPDILEKNEKEYILLHERTHIKHGDWLIKIVGMFAVAVHWFNPLVWIAFMLFEQDIEMSCDESVVADMDNDMKQAYTMSIVSHATKSSSKKYLVTPLGFSKVNFCKTEVTNRVKNLINFKKGTAATAIAITAALFVTGMACVPNSKTNADEVKTAVETTEETKTVETKETVKATKETEKPAETTETKAPAETKETEETKETKETEAPAESTEATKKQEPEETTASSKNKAKTPFETEETDPPFPKSDYDLKPGSAKYAKTFVGIPYKKGGKTEKGFDNMGFVEYLYFQLFSTGFPDKSQIENVGSEVSRSEAKVSDIVCFSEGDQSGLIAFYIGGGKAVYASPKEGKVVCKDISKLKIKTIRHVVDYSI